MSYNVKAVLSAEDRGYTAAMRAAAAAAEDVEERTEKATSQAKAFAIGGVAAKAVAAAFGAVKSAVGSAISRLDTLNNYPKVMQSLGFSAEQAASSQDKLVAGIEGLPTTLDGIVGNTQQLVSSLGDLDKATDTAIALNNMFLAGGQGADAASRAFTQYNQMLAKGKVDMQSWMSVVQTAPAQVQQLAQTLLGATANQTDLYNALQSGQIALSDLNNAVITLNNEGGANFNSFAQQAMDATGGIATGLSNIRSAITKGVANTISAIDQALQAADLPGISEQLVMLKTGINTVFSAVQKVAQQAINMLAPAIKFVKNHFDAFKIVIEGVVGGLVAMKIAKTVQGYLDKLREAGKKTSDKVSDLKDAVKKLTGEEKLLVDKTKATEKAEEARTEATKKMKTAEEAATRASDARQKALIKEAEANIAYNKAAKEDWKNADLNANYKNAALEASIANKEALEMEAVAQSANTTATQASVTATEMEAAANTASNTQISMKEVLLGVLSGELDLATAKELAWNAAMNANPIGMIITLVTVLTTALRFLVGKINEETEEEKAAREATEKWHEEIDETIQASKDLGKELKEQQRTTDANAASAADLTDQIVKLYKGEKNSADEKKKIANLIEQLTGLQDDLNVEYDEETGLLKGGTKALEAKNKAATQAAKLAELEDERNKVLEQQRAIESDIADLEEKLAEKKAAYEGAIKGVAYVTGSEKKALQELIDNYEIEGNDLWELTQQKDAYAQKSEELSAQIVEQRKAEADAAQEAVQIERQAMSEAVNANSERLNAIQIAREQAIARNEHMLNQAIQNHTAILEQLTEKNQETVQNMQETWQGYVDHATDMFNTLSEKSELSAQQMIDNMVENQRVIENWGNNMQALRDRFAQLGLNDAVLDQLMEMGPEGAGYVAQFVTASDEQLKQLSSVFSSAGTTATEAMYNSMSDEAAENAKAVEYLVTEVQDSLDNAIASANWADTGQAIPTGLHDGIIDRADYPIDAVKEMGNTIDKTFKNGLQIASPSKVFDNHGRYIDEGLAKGIDAAAARPLSVVRSLVLRIISIVQPIMSRMRSIGISAGQGFAQGLASTAGAVQATAANIANAAAATIQNALQIHSPSRVLERLGEYTGQGFINGISAMERALTRTVDHFAETASGISVSSWDAGPNRGYTLAGANGINLAGGGAHYSVTVPLMIDGHEFAVAVVDDITDQQDRNSRHDARKNGVK